MSKSYRVIRPDRYLRLEPVDGVVSVHVGGVPLLSSDSAKQLHEGDREPVIYVPMDALPPGALLPTDRTYACRWKGTARYFDLAFDGRTLAGAVWRYADPPDDLAALSALVAFDPAQTDVTVSTSAPA